MGKKNATSAVIILDIFIMIRRIRSFPEQTNKVWTQSNCGSSNDSSYQIIASLISELIREQPSATLNLS
jgi:hypothetical protein